MIVVRYQQPLLNYVGRMIGEREAALDLCQEVFVKAYGSLDSYRPEYKFRTWLFKIASNPSLTTRSTRSADPHSSGITRTSQVSR